MTIRTRSGAVRALAMLVVGALVAMATPAAARIGTVTGNIVEISPPPSVDHKTGVCSASDMFAFDEIQDITLAAQVKADIGPTPGITYTKQPGAAAKILIPAGTMIDAHFIHSNDCKPRTQPVREATLTFPNPILGIMSSRTLLNNSDVLGASGTLYGGVEREWDMGSDWLTVIDEHTIFVHAHTGNYVDHLRVLTVANAAPDVEAGGPYAGVEGFGVPLSGSYVDIDDDAVTIGWSISYSADPGTICTITDDDTLTPTVTCDDDALVTATLTVDDGISPPVSDSELVTIGNAPPEITSLTLPALDVPFGAPVNLSAAFTDSGGNDTHTGTIAWGDTNTSSATVNQLANTASGSHVYSATGVYTVTLTIEDDDGGFDTVTGEVSVNGAPTANANGPYTGGEGSNVGLVGTASDDDGDDLTTTWTFTPGAADPGTSCTSSGDTTLAPSISCNDDVVVDAQLTVDDGVNTPVTSDTTVTFSNEAPSVASPSVTAGPIAVGQTVNLSAAFTDAGTNDTHTGEISWGDLTTTTATIAQSPGSGTASGAHSYSEPGIYMVTVTVTDDDGGSHAQSVFVTVNAPPTADAGGPYVGFEGSPNTLSGSVSDLDGDSVSISWGITWTGDATSCILTDDTTLTPSITCNDDATVTATLTASDGINTPVASVTTLEVGNVSPTAGVVSTSPTMIAVGGTINTSVTVNDVGTNDTHTASIDWDDTSTSAGTVTESSGSGTVSGSHVYTAPGVYTLSITISDDDGGQVVATAFSYIVVYDPEGGHVRSTAHYDSPSGAYTPEDSGDADVTGDASIGMEVQYDNAGSTVPSGHADFRFRLADLEMDSTGISWLVVENTLTHAYFVGTGTVNGVSGYEFLVSVIDGSPDRVRVRVWETSSGTVIYDNQYNAPVDTAPLTATSSGQIVIDS